MSTCQDRRKVLKRRSALKALLLDKKTPLFSQGCLLSEGEMRKTIRATFNVVGVPRRTFLSISFVSKEVIQKLNYTFRGKNRPTNILSFCDPGSDAILRKPQPTYLGELIIAPEILLEEAIRYEIPARARWTHLLVHGTLHLLGYDHQEEDDRLRMEALEREILKLFHLSDPYLIG